MHESYPEPELRYTAEQEQAGQAVLERWALGHIEGSVRLQAYDPKRYPFQNLNVVEMEARPDIDDAWLMGAMGMGPENYQRLIEDLQLSGIIRQMTEAAMDARNPQSSVIVTPHFRNILDTPLSHNAAFVASSAYGLSAARAFADKNVIVANHMVKRLSIKGVPVPLVLQQSGRMLFGHPLKRSLELGMPPDVIQSGNRALMPVMKSALKDGAVMHMALTETRAKKIRLPDGSAAKMLPRVDGPMTQLVKKRMAYMAGLPMDIRPGFGKYRLIGLIDVFRDRDVHYLMRQSAEILTEMSGEKVVYGLPDGAEILSEEGS